MLIGSLCTGTGCLDRAVQNVIGGELAWVADDDKAASKLLAYRFPETPNLGDIKTVNWNEVQKVDVITCGFPCQPISDAGQRLGTQDDRWIFPYIIECIRSVRPSLIFMENVSAITGRGLSTVLGSLAEAGFDAEWGCIPASAVGAPHRRERWFLAAHASGAGLRGADSRTQPHDLPAEGPSAPGLQAAQHPRSEGLQRCAGEELPVGVSGEGHSHPAWWGDYAAAVKQWESILGRPAPFPVIARPKPGAVTTRINPRFSEWMMGMDSGWVTDVPGLLIKRQLILIGNSVVSLQAQYALRELLTR